MVLLRFWSTFFVFFGFLGFFGFFWFFGFWGRLDGPGPAGPSAEPLLASLNIVFVSPVLAIVFNFVHVFSVYTRADVPPRAWSGDGIYRGASPSIAHQQAVRYDIIYHTV